MRGNNTRSRIKYRKKDRRVHKADCSSSLSIFISFSPSTLHFSISYSLSHISSSYYYSHLSLYLSLSSISLSISFSISTIFSIITFCYNISVARHSPTSSYALDSYLQIQSSSSSSISF